MCRVARLPVTFGLLSCLAVEDIPHTLYNAVSIFLAWITDDGNERDIHEIHEMLREYNHSHREASQSVPIGVFLEDGSGRKLGGLTGETFGNWLCIQYLFVSERLRGQGIGSRLLAAAESEALQRGCRYAFVDTFSFQAPTFYENHGYCEVFTLENYPYTGKRHYYTKELL